MVKLSEIYAQLTKIGIRKTWISSPEIRQLQHILMDNEKIVGFCSGRYHGGFAILVATPIRLLLVDKKPLYLTVDDIRYDMIAEVDFSSRWLDSTVTIFTVGKQHNFTSIRQKNLRDLSNYVQKRVMEVRHFDQTEQPRQPLQTPQAQYHYFPQYESRYFQPHHQHEQHYLTIPQPAAQLIDEIQDRGHIIAKKLHLPAHIIHQAVGAAAVKASRLPRFIHPYARGSFISRSLIR